MSIFPISHLLFVQVYRVVRTSNCNNVLRWYVDEIMHGEVLLLSYVSLITHMKTVYKVALVAVGVDHVRIFLNGQNLLRLWYVEHPDNRVEGTQVMIFLVGVGDYGDSVDVKVGMIGLFGH